MIEFASATRLIAMAAVATTLAACKEEDRGMIGTWLGEGISMEVLQAGNDGEGKFLVSLWQNPCETTGADLEMLSVHFAYGHEVDHLSVENDPLMEVPGFVLSYTAESDMLETEKTGPMLRLPKGVRHEDVTAEICAAAEDYRGDPKAWAKFRDGIPEA
jgi:hypothetical protein